MKRYNLACLFMAIGLLWAAPLAAQEAAQMNELERREDRLYYKKGSTTPFTGSVEHKAERMTGQVEEGKQVGTWIWRYETGAVRFQAEYEDNLELRSGMWYANGNKRSERTMKNGRMDGVATSWDEAGNVLERVTFKEGQRHGAYELHDQQGHLLYTANYAAGQLHGAATWWYDEGRKRWETHYEAGKRTGTWSQWSPEGRMVAQSEWANDTLVRRMDPRHGR